VSNFVKTENLNSPKFNSKIKFIGVNSGLCSSKYTIINFDYGA
jgi:hypothetical protein